MIPLCNSKLPPCKSMLCRCNSMLPLCGIMLSLWTSIPFLCKSKLFPCRSTVFLYKDMFLLYESMLCAGGTAVFPAAFPALFCRRGAGFAEEALDLPLGVGGTALVLPLVFVGRSGMGNLDQDPGFLNGRLPWSKMLCTGTALDERRYRASSPNQRLSAGFAEEAQVGRRMALEMAKKRQMHAGA